jgi:hypothetical protein
MNGAVFHTSAMMRTIIAQGFSPRKTVCAPGRPSVLRTLFTKPRFGSKIAFHVIAVTTVSSAHGTSTTVRSRPRPLKALCMAIAIASPSTSSKNTENPVNTSVLKNELMNASSFSAVW